MADQAADEATVEELHAQIAALVEEIDDVTSNCDSWKLQCLSRGRESQVLAGRLAAISEVLDGETVQSLQAEVGRLREEVARSEALRLSMVRFQAEQGGHWGHLEGGSSKTSLQLSKAGSSWGSPWDAGKSPPGSPGSFEVGPLQELLEIGEATLESPEDLKAGLDRLNLALKAAEERASEALAEAEEQRLRVEEVEEVNRELQEALEDEKLRANTLADQVVCADVALAAERDQARAEVAAEQARASDEGEDLIQEMAELRFRLTELVQQERELRAQAEGASLQRVQELEAQLLKARLQERQAASDREEALKRLEESRGRWRGEEEKRQAQESRLLSTANELRAANALVADLEAELAASQATVQVDHQGLVAELRKEIEAKRNVEKRVAEVMECMKAELGRSREEEDREVGGRDWRLPAEVRVGRREEAEVGTATWQPR